MKIQTQHTAHFVRRVAIALAVSALAGCSSLSGLHGTSEYGCKAPDGVRCDSVSGNYYNALQNNLPSQRQSRPNAPSGESAAPTSNGSSGIPPTTVLASGTTPATYTPLALRSQARVLRLWIKPWEDTDRDLNDQAYVYVQADGGHWQIEHAQRQIRNAYAPVRAPGNQATSASPLGPKPAAAPPAAAGYPGAAASVSVSRTLGSLGTSAQFAPSNEAK